LERRGGECEGGRGQKLSETHLRERLRKSSKASPLNVRKESPALIRIIYQKPLKRKEKKRKGQLGRGRKNL